MHEMAIAQSICDILEENWKKEGKRKISKVSLEIGSLSGVQKDCLIFWLENMSKNTFLEGAKIEIKEIPIKIKCGDCGKESVVNDVFFQCPFCQSGKVDIIGGRELNIESFEIED